ncbi:hypothetical protein STENM223S_03265 [Streptomyces tendae]
MADEQDKWLDRETAEFLLRGEPPEGLESADPAARDRAERLVVALGALAPPPAPSDEELPGEAAALAAFRKVHAERADASAQARAALGRGAAPGLRDTGVVRIGPRGEGARRARWSRPLRLGLAAALAVGMVGGVAVAAGTGVLADAVRPDRTGTRRDRLGRLLPRRSPAPTSPPAAPGRNGARRRRAGRVRRRRRAGRRRAATAAAAAGTAGVRTSGGRASPRPAARCGEGKALAAGPPARAHGRGGRRPASSKYCGVVLPGTGTGTGGREAAAGARRTGARQRRR